MFSWNLVVHSCSFTLSVPFLNEGARPKNSHVVNQSATTANSILLSWWISLQGFGGGGSYSDRDLQQPRTTAVIYFNEGSHGGGENQPYEQMSNHMASSLDEDSLGPCISFWSVNIYLRWTEIRISLFLPPYTNNTFGSFEFVIWMCVQERVTVLLWQQRQRRREAGGVAMERSFCCWRKVYHVRSGLY